MKVEIEISDDTVEVFKELLEESEWDVPGYIGRAVDGLGMLLSGDIPSDAVAITMLELLVDPPELEDEEDADGVE